MNGYTLVRKLRQVRAKVHLSSSAQLLFHELVAVCNENEWQKVFAIKTIDLCSVLGLSSKTISKLRKTLAEAGLITFNLSRDKRVGCYYSFENLLHDDDEKTPQKMLDEQPPSPVTISGDAAVENALSPVITPVTISGDTPFSPIYRIKTINRESDALACDPPHPAKKKPRNRKKEVRHPALNFPYHSEQFMTVWQTLYRSPKWKRKTNTALQLSLNKLAKFEEAFAIMQMERAIESNWTGVVFPETAAYYEEWRKKQHDTHQTDYSPDITSFNFD